MNIDTNGRGTVGIEHSRQMFLAIGASDVEVRLIEEWRRGHFDDPARAPEGELLRTPRPTAAEGEWATFVGTLDRAAVRVSWLPPVREGRQSVKVVDLLRGNPRRPNLRRQAALSRDAERFRVIEGESATLAALRARWGQIGTDSQGVVSGFARFVARRGVLAVERAEYRVLGAEYKVPKLVREQITISTRFEHLTRSLAESVGRPVDSVAADAHRYLNEMVAGSSKLFIDFTVQFAKFAYQQGYDHNIDFDKEQIETLRSYMARYPALVLPSHRSNLDALVIPATLHEHHLPRTHTFGGINMAMWPLGPLFRNGGTIFIRRDAQDNPVYKSVLREYVGYLMEKRFSLQWYIEGTRSRTGKLLPPKLGLLAYVVDAYREGRADDIAVVPASVAYDQFHDVTDYATEAAGLRKKPENLAWAIKYLRSQRKDFGKIYVRFHRPLLMSEALGSVEQVNAMSKDELRLAMQKIGLEVARRINAVTPITGTAMVTLAMLATDGRARTVDEIVEVVRGPLEFARAREVPMTEETRGLHDSAGVRRTLEALARHDVVQTFDGPEVLYSVGPEQHVTASYYRNTIVHFFLVHAIIELAAVRTASRADAGEVDDASIEQAFFADVARIRDLLKFDFFFEDRDAYLDSVRRELDTEMPAWREQLSSRGGLDALIESFDCLWSPVVLRSILEAYWVAADALQRQAAIGTFDDKAFLRSLPDLGRYALRRGWIRSPEAVSAHLFRPALELMKHFGLTENSGPEVVHDRIRFATELRCLLDGIDVLSSRAAR